MPGGQTGGIGGRLVWEGFKDSAEAKECLAQVIKAIPDEAEPLHRWVLHLLSVMD